MKPEDEGYLRDLMIIPVGPSGCGKTSFRRELREGVEIVSPDEIRFRMLDYEHTGIDFDSSTEKEVWIEAYANLDRLLSERKSVYFDATNLTFERRYKLVARARKAGYWVKIVYFDIQLERILRRNAGRERKVPERVIAQQFCALQVPESWECDEYEEVG